MSKSAKCKSCLKQNAFVIFIISGVVAGIALGIGLRFAKPTWTKRELTYFKFPGDLLLRMLKMLIIPLVVTSMIAGMASLNSGTSSWIGLRAVVYYLTTTLIAVIIGIVLVVTIQPGSRGANRTEIHRSGKAKDVQAVDSILDLIRNALPENVISAAFEREETVPQYITVPVKYYNSTSNVTVPPPPRDYIPVLKTSSGSNVLGLIVFSLAFGVAVNKIPGRKGETVKLFFEGANEAILVVVRVVIWYTPIGIIFLLASKIIEMQDVVRTLTELGLYMITVITGLVIHAFIVLPLIFFIIVRKNPFAYMYGCIQCLLTAVSTASSSATLPVTFKCIEDINKVNKQISRFVLPIGATINMDGTALYEAVASIFIAQMNGIWLNVGQVITVSITATAAAIGAAGVPEAGLVTMVIVLTSVGLPTEDVTLILAIDWFLDRLRTSVNVWGDAVGAAVVESLSKKQLEEDEELNTNYGYDGGEETDDTNYLSNGKDKDLENNTNPI